MITAARKLCIRGHPLTPDNVILKNGKVRCHKCVLAEQERYRAKRRKERPEMTLKQMIGELSPPKPRLEAEPMLSHWFGPYIAPLHIVEQGKERAARWAARFMWFQKMVEPTVVLCREDMVCTVEGLIVRASAPERGEPVVDRQWLYYVR